MENAKKKAGYLAANLIKNKTRIGVGTGSTVHYFIERLAYRVKFENLSIKVAPTSLESAKKLLEADIPLIEDAAIVDLDLTVDGADQINPKMHLLKGLGGALIREKIVAMASRQYIIIADGSKKRNSLSGIVPVEYMQFGSSSTLEKLSQIAPVTIRMKNGTPFISDNGNLIADVFIEEISEIEKLDFFLCSIPGVVGTGLFYNLPDPMTIICD